MIRLEVAENCHDFIKCIAETEKECFSEPWSERAVSDFLEYEYNGALVCLADGFFSGYITYTNICGEIQIANVATKKEYRRMGIAFFLVNRLIAFGKKENAGVITLEVRSKNEPAVALYEKSGFVVVGERKNFYKKPGDNALLMNLELR